MPYNFQCKVCPKSYIVVSKFIEHLKMHKDEDEKAKTVRTQNEQNLGDFMLQRSIDIKLQKSYTISGNGLNVKQLSFQRQDSKVENEIGKANWCKTCDKTFSDIRGHMRIVHKKFKSSKCKLCDKIFSQISNLKTHVKIVHENAKGYKCDSCDRSFGLMGEIIWLDVLIMRIPRCPYNKDGVLKMRTPRCP